MPFLRLAQFSVWRGQTRVVHEVSLSVDRGEVLALTGSNGAGKTTLLEGLAGLHTSSGKVWIGGLCFEASGSVDRVAQGVTLCPDGRHLFVDMTVWENLLMGAYRAGLTDGQRRARAMAELVPWLRQRLRQRAGTLSGGEQQLVAVCRALMSNPTVLLLDSPTSGLGPAFRRQIVDLVREFVSRGNGAVVVTDDDEMFLAHVANARAVLIGGQLASFGPIASEEKVVPLHQDGPSD